MYWDWQSLYEMVPGICEYCFFDYNSFREIADALRIYTTRTDVKVKELYH